MVDYTPMNILDNELVSKYFVHDERQERRDPEDYYRDILDSMQQRIRKGERYLQLGTVPPDKDDEKIWEQTASGDIESFHGFQLRLPDRFQGEKEPCKCGSYQTQCPSCGEQHVFVIDKSAKPQPEADHKREQMVKAFNYGNSYDEMIADPVEEKIKQLVKWFEGGPDNQFKHLVCVGLERSLRELVALARRVE